MKRSFAFFSFLIVASTLSVSFSAHAARRVALLIGNSNYQHEKVLPNPVRDIDLVKVALDKLGFEVELLKDQDKRGMELNINRFVSKSAGADTALVFYAGHGTQSSKGGRSFLLPVNAKVEDDETLETDGVLAEDIAVKLEKIGNPAKLRLVILDACRSRKTTRGNDRGLAPPKPTDDYTLIAYSTKDGATADDGDGRHSPYAQALAKHLPRLAKEPVLLVLEDTADDVKAATKRTQNPQSYGSLSTRIGLDGVRVASIRAKPEPGPSAVQMELQAWTVAQRANSVAAYTAYLAEYPNGSYGAAARVALAGLKPAAPAAVNDPPVQPPAVRPATCGAGQTFKDCQEAHCPEMVVIPAGSFQMGSSDGDTEEKPVHQVRINRFAMGKYEVTQGQWKAVMGSNPSNFTNCGDNCPVEKVSWNDIRQYIQKLNQKTGQNYRLPSEAEWEYAARAGTTSKYWWGDKASHEYANYGKDECCGGLAQGRDQWENTSPVGLFSANAFGLHDMHGNVWEWVQDWYHDSYSGAPSDGSAWESGGKKEGRVLRGGSWSHWPAVLRSADRLRDSPGYRGSVAGFRLARAAP